MNIIVNILCNVDEWINDYIQWNDNIKHEMWTLIRQVKYAWLITEIRWNVFIKGSQRISSLMS